MTGFFLRTSVWIGLAIGLSHGLADFVQSQDKTQTWPSFGQNRSWSTPLNINGKRSLERLWQQEVGLGKSQVVGNRDTIFVLSGSTSGKGDDRALTTIATARSLETGEARWSYRTKSPLGSKQETFSGSGPVPQATPLLSGTNLVFVTFTGQMICLDISSGNEVWKVDLVQKFKAIPVQFGFSSSPVSCLDDPESFMVQAGGADGGLFKFDLKTGEPKWQSRLSTFSYSTPVFANLRGVNQWIVITQNFVAGIDDENGNRLWKQDLTEQGLTNVPAPLVNSNPVTNSRGSKEIFISGQGVKGTRCPVIERVNSQWTVSEKWENRRLQYFYTNWMQLDPLTMIGCTDKYLASFDARTGKVMGRWRGYGDGNLIRLNNHLLCLNGKGALSVLSYNVDDEEWVESSKFQIGDGRFWTPPTIIGERILIRFGKELHCLRFCQEDSTETLKNRVSSDPKSLELNIDN